MAKAEGGRTRTKFTRSAGANEAAIPRRRQPSTPSSNGAPEAFVAMHDSAWVLEKMTPLVDERKVQIGRLISNSRMKDAWKDLERREAKISPWFARDSGKLLYLQIKNALEHSSAPPTSTWSTAKLQRAYADIQRLSKELSANLRVLYDGELTNTTVFLDSSTLRNLAVSLRLGILQDSPADVDLDLALKSRLRFLPAVPELLDLLAERTRLKAQRRQKQSRPASVGTQCQPFITHVSDYFFSRYRARLHATVATITSVVFDRNVSEDLVKKLLQRRFSALAELIDWET